LEAELVKLRKEFRRFQPLDFYDQSKGSYNLLPINFFRLNDHREVIINEVGDFVFADTGTFQKIVQKKLDKSKDFELYAELLSNFFISEETIPPNIDVLANRYKTKKNFLNSFTGLHIFVISLRCEHTCAYCQVSRVTENRDMFDMGKDHIDKGIDIMMKSPNPSVTMEFQGGEALLAFDNIKYAVARSKELAPLYGKEVTYVICTNLALANEEILTYCKEEEILISASLDGPKMVHDKNRHKPKASSYDLTIKGIELASSIVGKENVSALMTTTKHSLDYPIEIVEEYFNRGFHGIFLRNISPYGFALRSERNRYLTKEFLEFYKIALGKIIELNKAGHYFTEDFSRILLTKILTPFNVGFVDMQSPSGIINGVIVFNYDGAVYCSDESRMLAEEKDYTFKLGHLSENSYEELVYGIKSQRIAQIWANETLAGCADCAFQQYCGADPVHNWATPTRCLWLQAK
jgi:His-Xaa-Ser system radical SAM maturase HxsB